MPSDTLRVLLVDGDPRETERISSALVSANHTVLPATDFEAASEVLDMEKIDAVLLGRPLRTEGLEEFTSKLRALERTQRAAVKTPIFSFSPERAGEGQEMENLALDGFLSEPFEPAKLTNAMSDLLRAVNSSGSSSADSQTLPLLNRDGFLEQVAYERELLVEIIDLFLAEREREIPQMREALAAGDFDRLNRLAHTIKGSLGSICAARARARAQLLETAAKARRRDECELLLQSFSNDLDILEPELLALRNSSSAPA